jgi:hypothetical protein
MNPNDAGSGSDLLAGKSGLPPWWVGLVLALALVVVAGVRIRLRDCPLERDEGEYAYAGQLILEGIPPYQLAYNMKMPGTYLAYAAMMAVFGQTPAGIHLGLLVVHLATLGLLFQLARWFCKGSGAAVATAAFGVMTLSPAVLGLAAHATHFVLPPALAGVLLLLRAEVRGGSLGYLTSGFLFGVAFLMKQPALVLGCFGGLFLIYLQLRRRPIRWQVAAWRVGVFTFGGVLPFLLVCGWLTAAGVFPRFWFWTISYAREYSSLVPLADGWINARASLLALFRAAPCPWAVTGVGLVALCVTRLAAWQRLFLVGWLLFSFLAVCPGLYFRNHYFILLLPAVALLIGLAVGQVESALARPGYGPGLRYVPLVLALLACGQSLYADRTLFFSLSPREASLSVYGPALFIESLDIARFIQKHTGPEDRIVVLGSEPQIYFYAHRHSGTGYIYTYPLTEPQPFARHMQEEMIREIETNRPAFVVFFQFPNSWLVRPTSNRLLFDWFKDYRRGLELVGVLHPIGPRQWEEVWGPEASTTDLGSSYFVAVFRRPGSEGTD